MSRATWCLVIAMELAALAWLACLARAFAQLFGIIE